MAGTLLVGGSARPASSCSSSRVAAALLIGLGVTGRWRAADAGGPASGEGAHYNNPLRRGPGGCESDQGRPYAEVEQCVDRLSFH